MQMDRRFQKDVLNLLAIFYPFEADEAVLMDFLFDDSEDEFFPDDPGVEKMNPFQANMAYLVEHGLIVIDGHPSGPVINSATITAKGIDFLADDGGLGAILNTVTVKFDADNIRSLVEQGLLKADLPEEKQSAIRKALHALPGTALQTVVTTLVQQAMTDPVKAMKAVAGVLGIPL